MQSARMARLAHQFQQEIALIIQRELKNPHLGFVTVTRVELSNDVRHAKVWFSCLEGGEERARFQQALRHSAGFIRGLLKRRFCLKVIPELSFHYDESIAHSIALSETFERLKSQRDEGVSGEASESL